MRRHVRDFGVRHIGGTALVLIYHRVAELERDPQLLAVTPEHFDEQMRMLAQSHNVIPLTDLLDTLRSRRVPDRAVAVTFDDGYADNLTTAEPILASHGIPATVFVSSGYVLDPREYWWDELERILLGPGTLPELIELRVDGAEFTVRLEDFTAYPQDAADQHQGWTVLDSPTTMRQRAYLDLCGFVRPLATDARNEVLRQLRTAAGTELVVRPTHRPLTDRETRELDSRSLVEVGAHTANHPVLAQRTPNEQRGEILTDRDSLATICARSMRTFSYPYGGLTDYTDETVEIVRDAGFVGACSNHPGIVKPWTDAYRLPRNLVRDWGAQELSARLKRWFDGQQ